MITLEGYMGRDSLETFMKDPTRKVTGCYGIPLLVCERGTERDWSFPEYNWPPMKVSITLDIIEE